MIAAFIILIGGASFLYNRLSPKVATERLSTNITPPSDDSQKITLSEAHASGKDNSKEEENADSVMSSGQDNSVDSDISSGQGSSVDSGLSSEQSSASGTIQGSEASGTANSSNPSTTSNDAGSAVDAYNDSDTNDNADATDDSEIPTAPDFTVYDIDGDAVSLSDFIGKPVIINFWASWCGPCKMEMPEFEEKFEELGGDIQFLMVNLTDGNRETIDTAAAYIEESGYTFPVYFDTDQDAAYTYGVYLIPSTYFIGADGSAVAMAQGAIDGTVLDRGISMIYSPDNL